MHGTIITAWWVWGYWGCGMLPLWRQGRRGLPAMAMGVIASFAILFVSALLLQLLGLPLSRFTWFVATILFSLGFALLPSRHGEHTSAATGGSDHPLIAPQRAPVTLVQGLLWLAIATALAVTIYRALAQPLVGFDTVWRWDFLARQIVREHNLDFYPAFSASDFMRYPWPEGLPPLVSLLYAWSYLGTGSLDPVATAPVVLLVALLVFYLVGVLAARAGGRAAGAWACALLASSAIHTWAVSMGQEAGVITVGLLAMVIALERDAGGNLDWLLAGLGAGLVAISREYGFCAVGVGAFLVWRSARSWRLLGGFLVASIALALPWYVRTWWRTGNPLYNQDLQGIFPVNEMHAGLLRFYMDVSVSFHEFRFIYLCLWALGAAVLIGGAIAVAVRRSWPVGAGVVSVSWLLLWAWSISQSSGGIAYTLRVLSPVLALAAVAGGVALSRLLWPPWRRAAACMLLLLSVEASLRALLVLASPLDVPPRRWLSAATWLSALSHDEAFDRMAKLVGSGRVLSDNAYHFAFLADRGVAVLPPWSPEVNFLTAEPMDVPEVTQRLRAAGVRFILRSATPDLVSYLRRYPFFQARQPWLEPVMKGEGWILFALRERKD